jgi:hypothetical protein
LLRESGHQICNVLGSILRGDNYCSSKIHRRELGDYTRLSLGYLPNSKDDVCFPACMRKQISYQIEVKFDWGLANFTSAFNFVLSQFDDLIFF